MCDVCDNFKPIQFDEEHKEIISMSETYDETLEENIYDEIYLFKPKFTSKVFLTHLLTIFTHELYMRLDISFCPICGRKLNNKYLLQQKILYENS